MSTGDKSRWYNNHFWPLGGAVCAQICTRSESLRSIGCKRTLGPTSWKRKALSRTQKSKDKKLEATRVRFVKSLLNRVNIGCKRALEPTSWKRKALSRTLKSKDKKLEATRVRFVKSLLNRIKVVCEKSKRNGSACVSCLT